VWTLIEQSVISGIVCLCGVCGSGVVVAVAMSLLIIRGGGAALGNDNYRPFNYLSDFAENRLKCV